MKTQFEKDLDGEKDRTPRQNRALHLYFQKMAETLNDAGLDMRTVLKPGVEIPWSKESVKNYLWKPVQSLQLGKESTTELTTKEIDLVFETVNRVLSKHGIHQPFPSMEAVFIAAEAEYQNKLKNYKKTK